PVARRPPRQYRGVPERARRQARVLRDISQGGATPRDEPHRWMMAVRRDERPPKIIMFLRGQTVRLHWLLKPIFYIGLGRFFHPISGLLRRRTTGGTRADGPAERGDRHGDYLRQRTTSPAGDLPAPPRARSHRAWAGGAGRAVRHVRVPAGARPAPVADC